jgi:hypothetical protein
MNATGRDKHGVIAVWEGADPWPRCASCGDRVALTTDGWRHVSDPERKAS